MPQQVTAERRPSHHHPEGEVTAIGADHEVEVGEGVVEEMELEVALAVEEEGVATTVVGMWPTLAYQP